MKEHYLKYARIDYKRVIENKDKILNSKYIEDLDVYEFTPFDINDSISKGSDLVWYELRKLTKFFLRMQDFLAEFKDYILNDRWKVYEEIDDTSAVLYIKRRYGDKELEKYIQQENIVSKEIDGEIRYYKRIRILKERWFYMKHFLDKWKDELYTLNNADSGRAYRVHIFKSDIKKILNRAKNIHNYKIADIKYPVDTILMYLFEDQYVEYWQGEWIPNFVWSIYELLDDELKHLTYNKMVNISKSDIKQKYIPLTEYISSNI